MSTGKNIDKICIAAIVITLIITLIFMNGAAFGIVGQAYAIEYENTIFDTSYVHTINIDMDDWDEFIESCEDEEYTSCTITVDGEKYSNVAIRAKGNTSLSNVKSMNSQRYSFKLEFDHYNDALTLDGLDKLCLNNLIQDNTMMKDYVVYQMMSDFGVDAPLCSYAYITVNGEDWGLYLAVEGIEDSFLERNYNSVSGDLYKPDSMSFGGGRGNGKDFNMDDFDFSDSTIDLSGIGLTEEDLELLGLTDADLTQVKLSELDFDKFSQLDMSHLDLSGLDLSEFGDFGGFGDFGSGTDFDPGDMPGMGDFDPGDMAGGQNFGGDSSSTDANGFGGDMPQGGGFGGDSSQQGGVSGDQGFGGDSSSTDTNVFGGDMPQGGGFGGDSSQQGGGFDPGDMAGGQNFGEDMNVDSSSSTDSRPSMPDASSGTDSKHGGTDTDSKHGGMGGGNGGNGGMGGGMGSDDVKLKYIDDDAESYSNIFDNAKTDVTEADQDRLISSLKRLSSYTDLEETVNIEEVLRYFVVHNFSVNGDSYTGSMIHNYYLYEDDGIMSMIPWDYNLAFGTFQGSNASSSVNSSIDNPVSGGDMDDRPMVGWIFSDETYTQSYHELFETFVEEWIDSGKLTSLISDTAEMISSYVESDPTKFCTYEEFESGVEALTQFVTLRGQAVKNQLNGDDTLVDCGSLNLSDMGTMSTGGGGGFSMGKSSKSASDTNLLESSGTDANGGMPQDSVSMGSNTDMGDFNTGDMAGGQNFGGSDSSGTDANGFGGGMPQGGGSGDTSQQGEGFNPGGDSSGTDANSFGGGMPQGGGSGDGNIPQSANLDPGGMPGGQGGGSGFGSMPQSGGSGGNFNPGNQGGNSVPGSMPGGQDGGSNSDSSSDTQSQSSQNSYSGIDI